MKPSLKGPIKLIRNFLIKHLLFNEFEKKFIRQNKPNGPAELAVLG